MTDILVGFVFGVALSLIIIPPNDERCKETVFPRTEEVCISDVRHLLIRDDDSYNTIRLVSLDEPC